MKRLALAVALLIALAAPAWAGFDEGWEAYKRRDYATAIGEFMPLAEQGHTRAQLTLTVMVMVDGCGPWDCFKLMDREKLKKWHELRNEKNRNEAKIWFRNAANQGDTKALTLLGTLGSGQEEEAVWLKAAEQGEVTAQKLLSMVLAFQNKMSESANWARKAAEQGDRWGQWRLGSWYSHGPQRDKVRAYMWLTLAVEQGSEKAADERDEVAEDMTPAQIAEAQRLAREWKPKRSGR
ncbi:MAG: tetratricopeptide repeat protein [Candidatus Methylomirabilales bacterium]